MNILTQQCCNCKQELSVENFCRNKNSKSGYHWTCKACIKEYQLSKKDELKVYQQEYQKQYRIENKEILNKRASKWSKDNPERHRAAVNRSNAKRKDKLKEYMKEYGKVYRLRKKLEKQQNEQ